MTKVNSTRCGCRDVFHTFLVKNATYDSPLEIPCLQLEMQKPNKLISFTKALHSTDYDAWVHFYEDDASFERLWNRPNIYLPILKRFNGVISPDFSVYRDMPLVMQFWNIYRSRAIAFWLQENGLSVIPNIRFSDDRTYNLSCVGIKKHGVIAVGSHGCMKIFTERAYFQNGLNYVIETLKPTTLVVYGTTPQDVFNPYKEMGIEVLQFDSEFMQSRKVVSA